MQTNDILVIQPRTIERLNALRVFLSTFNLDFEVEKPYNEEFVKKIQTSRQEFEDGNFKSVQKKDLKSFLGL
jgi:adenylate kinase family enzyme